MSCTSARAPSSWPVSWAILREYTVATVLGPIFVVSSDVAQAWLQGAAVGLRLAGHGLSVVAM